MEAGARAVVYCVVPRDLAPELHERLRRHFREEPLIEVVVERRVCDRRRGDERRGGGGESAPATDRRVIRNLEGRRVGERRAPLVGVKAPELPRRTRAHAERVTFVERLEPPTKHAEELDTARLVTAFQGGDREAFSQLYMRYFDRVYGYLLVVFRASHEAEDATQQVFTGVLEALPQYERRRTPFSAWLFTVVRNHAINHLKKHGRVDPVDPSELHRRRELSEEYAPDLRALDWITDRELLLFVERLPLAQRQVLLLRYMLDLSHSQVASVLGRSEEDVRVLQHRAQRFLARRLTAVGRGPRRGDPARSRVCTRYATVLRARRFALMR